MFTHPLNFMIVAKKTPSTFILANLLLKHSTTVKSISNVKTLMKVAHATHVNSKKKKTQSQILFLFFFFEIKNRAVPKI